ncbi:MAG: glycosyltransferase, partial [Solirubrobacteraceae bacterium]
MNELPQTSQTHARASVGVVIAAADGHAHLRECVESVSANTPTTVTTLIVAPTAAAVNGAFGQLAPADVLILSEPCRVTQGWLERMRETAREDSNTATASALADAGTALALSVDIKRAGTAEELLTRAEGLAAHTLGLRPRLGCAVGPCVYVRREALELVGALDEKLDLQWALEVDFAQRCLLSGLAHLAADDVLVQPLAPARDGTEELPAALAARYPYLSSPPAVADSGVLALALEAARGPHAGLWVTLDARALDGAVTGTQVHILELILALAHTGRLRLRLLVRSGRIDRATLELLRGLPETEILAFEDLDPSTARSTVFHRPQQTFSPGDVAVALALGERFVLSQLDLIAYRNPGYFADADAWQDYRRASRHGMSAAERVVVFSEHTRRELLSDALVEDARIRVVAPGLDHRTSSEQRRPSMLQPGSEEPRGESDAASWLADGFLLCLGTDFRHKNRLFALRLLAALRAEHGWEGSLVLAGTHIQVGSSLELEREFLREHRELGEAVVAIGPVSEPEKAWLLAHAGAVVYPSVYEGFGLVPFEAALSGVPCVFAPQSSLAEEAPAGTAAIVPWDARSSAATVHALLTDPSARR